MRIFLDVGSHHGETLNEVLNPKYAFDRVYCFEPSQYALKMLRKKTQHDDRVIICPFGLSNENIKKPLYHPGTLSGSIFKDSNFLSDNDPHEIIELRDTSSWLKENVNESDFIVMKMNCEGSEIYIIDSLLGSNLLKNIYSILVTFDIREFEGHEHSEIEVRKRLRKSGLNNFCFSDDVMIGLTHDARIANWLKSFGVHENGYDIANLKLKYKINFNKYSKKNGYLYYLESRIKVFTRYKSFPEPLKIPLRFLKKILWTNREKDLN